MRYKITILDSMDGKPSAEIINSDDAGNTFPFVPVDNYCLANGQCGIPVKIEKIIEATGDDVLDNDQPPKY